MKRSHSKASVWATSIAGVTLLLLCVGAYAFNSSAQQRPPVTIPFAYDRETQPFLLVQVSINKSKPIWFVLDTGYYWPIAVTTDFAKKIGLPLDRRIPYAGTEGGKIEMIPVTSIRVGSGKDKGSLDIPVRQVVLIPSEEDTFSSVFRAYGIEVGGVIGLSALEQLQSPVLIDFGQNTLTIGAERPKTSGRSDGVAVSLTKKWWQYGVVVRFPGGKTAELLLDTGSYSVLFKPGVSDLPIKARSEAATTAQGLGGRGAVLRDILLSELTIGDLSEKDVTAAIDNRDDNTLPWDGVLGLSLLNRFRVWLDFAAKEMVLERVQDYEKRLKLPGAAEAFLIAHADGYVVQTIAQDGPLYKAGVREGDKVIEVDGTKLSGLSPFAANAILRGFAGAEARLLIERTGEKKTVTYTRRSLFDIAGEATETPSAPRSTPGLTLAFTEKGFVIVQIQPGSPAEQAGLKVGDELVEFNGLRFMSLTAEQILKLSQTLRDLTRAGDNKLVIRREGRLMEVVLKL